MTATRRDRAPADQSVRDGAMRDLDTSIFLQAGAGTGKTSVLVGRVIEAVKSGRAELREIVAITFTEKAAGELRDRVRRQLYRSLNGADAAGTERLRAAIQQVDAAHIETIHAFASSLLRERPLEAGLDPGFEVMDAVSEQLAFDEEWQNWIWGEEQGAARPRIERCLRLGLRLDHLRRLAFEISEFRDLEARETAAPVPIAVETLPKRLQRAVEIRAQAHRVSDALGKRAERLVESLEELQDVPPEVLEGDLAGLNIRAPALGRGTGEDRIRLLEEWKELEEEHAAYAAAVRAQALAEFIDVAVDFVTAAATRRKRGGRLSFQDLLLYARDLLQQEPGVRRYFRDRCHVLLVDEFQDTDPLQAEIVMLLAARNEPADWRAVEFEPGRIFLVGDPKQSIYRFRRADIDTYAEIDEAIRMADAAEPGSARIDVLQTNFRSRPDLVTWQNDVFGTVIQPDPDFRNAQPDYHPLIAHRDDGGPCVIALRPNTGAGWRSVGDARKDEASALARLISSMVISDDGVVTVRDGAETDERRKPRYRDVCLLVRNRTSIELYTEALDRAGIPYHLDSGRGFFQQQEIRDAAAILTALDDPSDEVAVVAALKSAPFSASDVDLLQLANAQRDAGGRGGRRAGFQLRPGILPDGYDGPLRAPIEQLLQLAGRKAPLSLPAYVDHVLRETHMLEIQLARGSTARAANLQIIVQRAADFAANEVDSLRPFVRWLSTQSRSDLAEAESPVTEVEDDVVRILTIHQAKGLEFPVVILAKMAAAENRDRQIAVVNRDAGRIDFQVGPRDQRFETPGYAAAQARQSVYERAEERRLLYVAATRARDWLVLPVFFTDRTLGYHADLAEALPGWLDPSLDVRAQGSLTMHVEELAAVSVQPVVAATPDVDVLWAGWQERHAAALTAGSAGPRFVVPSEVGHDRPKQPRETEPPTRSDDIEEREAVAANGSAIATMGPADSLAWSAATGQDARRRGIVLHDALFLADFDDPQGSAWRARRLMEERGLAAEADQVVRDLERTLASDLLARARAAKRVERELPLVSVGPDRVSEGYVDLAFEEGEGWVLVDYKSDQDPSAETIAGYAQQVRTYASMLRETGAAVAEAYLLFTRTGREHPVTLEPS